MLKQHFFLWVVASSWTHCGFRKRRWFRLPDCNAQQKGTVGAVAAPGLPLPTLPSSVDGSARTQTGGRSPGQNTSWAPSPPSWTCPTRCAPPSGMRGTKNSFTGQAHAQQHVNSKIDAPRSTSGLRVVPPLTTTTTTARTIRHHGSGNQAAVHDFPWTGTADVRRLLEEQIPRLQFRAPPQQQVQKHKSNSWMINNFYWQKHEKTKTHMRVTLLKIRHSLQPRVGQYEENVVRDVMVIIYLSCLRGDANAWLFLPSAWSRAFRVM